MSTIGSTLSTLSTTGITTSLANTSQTSILADQTSSLTTKSNGTPTSLNPKGRLVSAALRSIRADRVAEIDMAHQSVYGLNLVRNWLPVENPDPPQDVVVDGRGRIETRMNYAEINGWLNDIPVNFTVMMANRTYENTKLVFSNKTKRIDNTTTNRWLV